MSASKRLRLWENDPESAPKPKKSFDTVGRFRSGAMLQGQVTGLKEWRVTTGDPEVAARIAELFGGEPASWETKTEDKIEVYTTVPMVEIVFDTPGDLQTQMVLWSRQNKLIRSCDGFEQAPNSQTGQRAPCVCPSTLPERKAAAKEGTGCEPSTQAFFRLSGEEELGRFRFQSGSWTLAVEVDKAQADLNSYAEAEPDRPIVATLSLEQVEYTPKTGPMAGRLVSFTKPVVTILGHA